MLEDSLRVGKSFSPYSCVDGCLSAGNHKKLPVAPLLLLLWNQGLLLKYLIDILVSYFANAQQHLISKTCAVLRIFIMVHRMKICACVVALGGGSSLMHIFDIFDISATTELLHITKTMNCDRIINQKNALLCMKKVKQLTTVNFHSFSTLISLIRLDQWHEGRD